MSSSHFIAIPVEEHDERWTIWSLPGTQGQRVACVDGRIPDARERIEVVPASHLEGAVSVEDVERLLSETSRYFAGDHVNAGVVVGEMRKRLCALAGGR